MNDHTGTSKSGANRQRSLRDTLIEHRPYINEHGDSRREMRSWKWGKTR